MSAPGRGSRPPPSPLKAAASGPDNPSWMLIRAFGCTLFAALALAGCGGKSEPSAGKPIGFEAQRVLALGDGGLVVGGIGISEGDEDCALDAREANDFDLRSLTNQGSPAGSRLLSGSSSGGCAETIDSLLETPDHAVLLSGWAIHPSDSAFEDNSSRD